MRFPSLSRFSGAEINHSARSRIVWSCTLFYSFVFHFTIGEHLSLESKLFGLLCKNASFLSRFYVIKPTQTRKINTVCKMLRLWMARWWQLLALPPACITRRHNICNSNSQKCEELCKNFYWIQINRTLGAKSDPMTLASSYFCSSKESFWILEVMEKVQQLIKCIAVSCWHNIVSVRIFRNHSLVSILLLPLISIVHGEQSFIVFLHQNFVLLYFFTTTSIFWCWFYRRCRGYGFLLLWLYASSIQPHAPTLRLKEEELTILCHVKINDK